MTEADHIRLAPMFDSVGAPNLAIDQKISLHFAIAKFQDDLKHFDLAIEHFDLGHELAALELRKKGRSFNLSQMTSRINAIISTFDKGRLSRASQTCSQSRHPLFIVGMVRSGTTLVEQILTRHSQVASGGELSFWPQHWQKLKPLERGFCEADIRILGDTYTDLLQTIAPDATMVTDKTPGNFIALGSIHAVFPNAKVIYCKRKPIDNCLSIYTTPFQSSHEWIHKRDDIVAFYRLHEKLIDHWRATLPPGVMHEVQYEDLVTNPEAKTREMIDFIGLNWENACLSPQENGRAVRTPSQWQVRQPVYRSSIDRWKNYEPWLGAFSTLLLDNGAEPR
jgi:hypothetical protein